MKNMGWNKKSQEFDQMMAALIRKRRKEHRFSQDYVAKKLDMAQSTLSRIERGKLSLSLIQWLQIKEVLGLTMSDLAS